MSLAALHLAEPEPISPPSDRSDSPQEPADPESREWLKLTDVCIAFLQGAPQAASWIPVSVVILSVPDATAMAPRSTWYLVFVPQDPSNQQTHTIDLSIRSWRVYVEELTFMFAFELGDVRDANANRYFVKMGTKRSFDYFLSYISYIKACRVGAIVQAN